MDKAEYFLIITYYSVKNLTLIILFCLLPFNLSAQNVIGKVVDSKTLEALPFVNVYLNNTTIGTVADDNGEFNLNTIKERGTCELVFSFVGYETYKVKVTIGERPMKIGIVKLIPSEIKLSNVEVTATRDKQWERNLKKFKKIFFGQDKQALACTILNPWVIDFPLDNVDNRFVATASSPIEINNPSLGYKIFFQLTDFWSASGAYSIAGNARFVELKSADAQQVAKWRENRKNCYQQSIHHLFKSILGNRINGEGFNLYTNRIGYKNSTTRSSRFYGELDKSVAPYDTAALVMPDKQKGFYKISLKGRIEIHYLKERAWRQTYDDVFGMVSWVTLNNGFVVVNKDGFPKNPTDVVVSGDMSSYRVAKMLPLDYKPEAATDKENIDFSIDQEQIYVHTDKPYYYPGETIWFKGYMNYGRATWRDSLSRTVYVELVERKSKTVLQSKTVEIVNGFFYNEFLLPDTMRPQMYYLRAYTNFNRNFGDENLFVKPLPVLNLMDKIKPVNTEDVTLQDKQGAFTIVADRQKYKPREKITLTLKLKDEDDNPVLANLSVAVVDSAQVVPLHISGTILHEYPLKEQKDISIHKTLPFTIERGINFSGKFLNEKNNPEKATLNVLQLNPRNFTMAQSDEKGIFTVSGLPFYDTATFSVQATRGKGEAYGKAEFIMAKAAAIDFAESEWQAEVIKTESPQRVLSEYESPKEPRMLQEVVIKSSKVEEQYQAGYRVKRPYGKPDYVLKAKDINASYGNLLLTLSGKVPGLNVRQANNDGEGTKWVVYLDRAGKNGSILFPKEVIVTINDALIDGSPDQILSTIDPATVESVEVNTGINVLYGSVGGNGIVSIYTKKEFTNSKDIKNIPLMKIPGYSQPRKFNAPDYSSPVTDATKADYRSTVYWDPNVVTNAITGTATISFYAADLASRYLIVAEGITIKGEAVRCEFFVDVSD